MSRLYNLIEEQILNVVSAVSVVTPKDDVVFFGINLTMKRPLVNFLIKLISALVYLGLALYFGVTLWNQGLAAVMPNVIGAIGQPGVMVQQLPNEYMQLVVTLFALMFIL